MHQHLVDDPDMEHLIIDSTIVRAHIPLRAHPGGVISGSWSKSRRVHYEGPRGR